MVVCRFSQRSLRSLNLMPSIMPGSPIEAYKRFGGVYCFHLHGRRINMMSQKLYLSSRLGHRSVLQRDDLTGMKGFYE
jgi:hypothetical protein